MWRHMMTKLKIMNSCKHLTSLYLGHSHVLPPLDLSTASMSSPRSIKAHHNLHSANQHPFVTSFDGCCSQR